MFDYNIYKTGIYTPRFAPNQRGFDVAVTNCLWTFKFKARWVKCTRWTIQRLEQLLRFLTSLNFSPSNNITPAALKSYNNLKRSYFFRDVVRNITETSFSKKMLSTYPERRLILSHLFKWLFRFEMLINYFWATFLQAVCHVTRDFRCK